MFLVPMQLIYSKDNVELYLNLIETYSFFHLQFVIRMDCNGLDFNTCTL